MFKNIYELNWCSTNANHSRFPCLALHSLLRKMSWGPLRQVSGVSLNYSERTKAHPVPLPHSEATGRAAEGLLLLRQKQRQQSKHRQRQVTQPLLWASARRIWLASGLWLLCHSCLWACGLMQSKTDTVYGDLCESQVETQRDPSLSSPPFCIIVSLSLVHWFGSRFYPLWYYPEKEESRQEERLQRPLLGLGGLVASSQFTCRLGAVLHLSAETLPL